MKGRRLLLSSLLVVAAYLAFFGDKTPSHNSAADVVQTVPEKGFSGKGASAPLESRPAVSRLSAGKAPTSLEVAVLIPRATLITAADDNAAPRDLFPALSWAPAPATTPAEPSPPMAPPVPFVYHGNKFEGGQWEAYLGRGEELLIVREGMTLGGIYKVKSINPTLTLVYLPLKQTQTIPIGGSQE